MSLSTFIIHFLYIGGTFVLGFLIGKYYANKAKANLKTKKKDDKF